MASKIFKVGLVGDSVFHFCGEVDESLIKNLPTESGDHWEAISYRMSTCNKFVEKFEAIGTGWKVSHDQIAIVINDQNKSRMGQEWEAITSSDPALRRAIIFLPKGSTLATKSYNQTKKKQFDKEIVPEIESGGLVIYPVKFGWAPLAVTCTCKAFFGCTTGCCASVTCKVVVGFCQSNPNCVKVDRTSNCSCST